MKKNTILALICLFAFVFSMSQAFYSSLYASSKPVEAGDCCEVDDPPILGVFNPKFGGGFYCDCQGLRDGAVYVNPNDCPLWCPSMP